jgi:hypothetical protein
MAVSIGSLAVGAVLGVAGLALWQYQSETRHLELHEIAMTSKIFSDAGSVLSAEGTITGEGVGYPNNSVTIRCFRDEQRCEVGSVQQIGPNQVGSVDLVDYPVTKWDDYEIVARDEPSGIGCSETTINIERKREAVEWVQAPVNLTKSACAKADTKLYRWTLETSPFWQRSDAATKKR